jgi:hypothetical protein
VTARKLDPYTLRSVVRAQRRRMRLNVRYWRNDEWLLMESFLDRLLAKARIVEANQAKPRKLTPATTLCGPHWDRSLTAKRGRKARK